MTRKILILFAIFTIASESFAVLIDQSNKSVDFCGKWSGFYGPGIKRFRPWVVALMDARQSPPEYFCSGTMISRFFVISGNYFAQFEDINIYDNFPAAHCFQNKGDNNMLTSGDVITFFRAHNLRNPKHGFALSPKKIYVHDEWNHLTQSYDADVALLEFGDEANKFEFYELFQPICLWKDELLLADGIVTGWDREEDYLGVEQHVPWSLRVPFNPNEQCFVREEGFRGRSSGRTFCVPIRGYSGDSGSGLIVKGVNKIYYLKGIASVAFATPADGCAFSDAIFTNVNKFKDWIHQIAGASLPTPAPRELT